MLEADGVPYLFAYGTLVPPDPDQRTLRGWQPDAVKGRLFDLGPYPGLIEVDDPAAPWVEGFVRPTSEDELVHRLDPYESVDTGLYRRIITTTRSDVRVYVYIYARSLPLWARGPIAVWAGPAPGFCASALDVNASVLEVASGGESCP